MEGRKRRRWGGLGQRCGVGLLVDAAFPRRQCPPPVGRWENIESSDISRTSSMPKSLMYLNGRQVLCRKCLKVLKIQYWRSVRGWVGRQMEMEIAWITVVPRWMTRRSSPPSGARRRLARGRRTFNLRCNRCERCERFALSLSSLVCFSIPSSLTSARGK